MKFIREYAKRMPGMERVDEIKKGSISFQNASFIPSAPRVGLEPTTLRLTVACSTIELSRNVQQHDCCYWANNIIRFFLNTNHHLFFLYDFY